MSNKRRDNKGRILRNGESQRKDGRYTYKYVDVFGNIKFVYSWRLTETDSTPKGKRHDLSLREKEKEILKDIENGVDTLGRKMTVLELVKKYTFQKRNVKYYTKTRYEYVENILKREKFGMKRIDTVKISEAKAWFIKINENGMSFNTIRAIRGVIKPAFNMALTDDLIRKNPFDFVLSDVIENNKDARRALTDDEEKRFINFLCEDKCYKKYYDEVIILLRTGMRISEMCGLTLQDVDFKNRKINIDHQLIRTKKMEYIIETPKTKSGIRQIPMTDEVYKALKNIINNRKITKNIDIDGKSNFLFIDKLGNPKVSSHYQEMFRQITKKFNKLNNEKNIQITPHVLRHTFCTKMAHLGMNPKTLQFIMGHSDISITLNLYTHASFDNALQEMQRISSL